MTEWLAHAFTPWMWLALALLFAGAEILLPGAFMIWLAAAAGATAVLAGLLAPAWPWQLAAFALFSVLAVLASRRWKAAHPIVSDDPALNRRGERLLGATVIVSEPIVNGRGKVMVGDSPWSATGPDAPVGTVMRVAGVDGATLRVEPGA